MTSLTSSSSLTTAQSPRAQMNARIASAVSARDISSTDQKALSTALDSIDQSLSSSSMGSTTKGGTKDKIDSLIDSQVSAGSLTDDQASELKSFFAQGPSGGQQPPSGGDGSDGSSNGSDMTVGATKGPGGPRGPGGPPPPPPASSDDETDSSTSSSTSTDGSSSLDDQLSALETMLDNLRKSIGGNANTYGSGSSGSSTQTGLVYQSVA